MATLSLREIILDDNWPGFPDPNCGVPVDGFDATTGHSCVTSPTYAPMTKIQVYQKDASGCTGYYTMIYLAFNEMSGAFPIACGSEGHAVCAHGDSTAWKDIGLSGDASNAPYYVMNVCATTEVTSSGKIALGCQKSGAADSDTTATTVRWQWFWCEGVCPAFDITQLDFDITCTATAWNRVMPVVDTSVLVIGVGDASFEGLCGLAKKVSA